jgi:flagellar FliL protein
MAEEKEAKKDVKKEEKPKRSFLKWIMIIVVVFVVGAGGYFGWSQFLKGDRKEAEVSKAKPEIEKEKGTIICPLDSFIVNLVDKAGLGKRYLKITMELEVGGEEGKGMVEKYKPKLRDTILLLLSSLSFDEINTMEGKLELKQSLLSRVNQILGEGLVQRIYFSEFVVQ